jgi:signal transduction histidine kinase
MTARLDELRSLDLFGGLTDQQLSELAASSSEVDLRPGLELFREGEHADVWWVLLDGVVDLIRRAGGEETVVARMDAPGRWAGGFRAWDDQGVYLATGRAATTGRVLRIPAGVLRERMTAWFPLGGHLIEGLYRTARSIEATARQRQSLATLGTLAAGLAHEINNPAAAGVRAVAFEPFYTTKDAAKSTGLGLDIARRIITERHGGTIDIDSRPGHTVLRVQIPVRAPER